MTITGFDSYEDLEVKEQMQRELNHRVAQRLIEDSEPGAYRTAILSAVNGRWSDIWKDVRRDKITIEQARAIVDSLLGARLLVQIVADQKHEFITQYLATPTSQL